MLDTFPPETPAQRIEIRPSGLDGFVSETTLRTPTRAPAAPQPAVRRRGMSLFVAAIPVVAAIGLVAGMLRAGDEPAAAPDRMARAPIVASPPPHAAPPDTAPPPVASPRVASQPPAPQVAPSAAARRDRVEAPVPEPASRRVAAPSERVPPPRVTVESRPAVTSGRPGPAVPDNRAAQPLPPPAPVTQEIATAARVEATAPPPAAAPLERVPAPSAAAPTTAPAAPVAAPALAPAPAAIPAANSGEGDRLAVRALLERYRGAYERLDANAAGETWPTVDRRALAKAFANLSSQTLRFENCDINLAENRGVASCRGLASYVGRVGKRSELAERQWTFLVRKDGEDWRIDSVKMGANGR